MSLRQVRIAGILWSVPDDFDVLERIAPRIAEAAKALPVPALESIARMWVEGYEHAFERVVEHQPVTTVSVRRIRISGTLLNSFLRDTELWKSTLPDDVNVVGIAGGDQGSQHFVLLVESKKFPAVGEGQLIPFIEPTFTRR